MSSRIYGRIKKAVNGIKPEYIKYCSLPIIEKRVFLEGGQGSNINGNMFAMLKELCTNKRWKDYETAFVVTESTRAKAEERMAFYGFKEVKLLLRNSDEYCRYLATSKYLMTDNSLPPYFNKREEQVYLNTWHGTPLKTLGKSNKSSLATLGNVQKNYFFSNYALFPNRYTENVFMKDYDIEPAFINYSFICNYPRNYVFYDNEAGLKVKKELGLADRKVYAYMPTWRDADTEEKKQEQINKTKEILNEFDQQLDDSEMLLVNLHFLLASDINCDEYEHVAYFDARYETYEVLNACDGLVTDYSSVFFDYAVTGKKIILFAYDKDEYMSNRGVYMPFEKLPFPIVEKVSDVIRLFNSDIPVPEDFIKEFCPNGSSSICEDVFELMATGSNSNIVLERSRAYDENYSIIYTGKLNDEKISRVKTYIEENPSSKYIVAYRHALSQEHKDAIMNIDGSVSVYGILTAYQFKPGEILKYGAGKLIHKKGAAVRNMFRRENRRLFPLMNPEEVISFSGEDKFMNGVLAEFDCKKKESKDNSMNRNSGEEDKTHTASEVKHYFPLLFNMGRKMRCLTFFSIKTPVKTSTKDFTIAIEGREYRPYFMASSKESFCHRGLYTFAVPEEDVMELEPKNHVYLRYRHNGKINDSYIKYFEPLGRFAGLRSPMCFNRERNMVGIFRQSLENTLDIYVRSVNVTDHMIPRIKQVIAFILSLFWKSEKAKKLILLYEKNSSKYEESASVLFERLIDMGYDNAYFIVDKNYEYIDRVPEKYRKNILYKYSFRHYLYFFRSKTFIGTEAMIHAIDLKTFNVLPLYKISRKNLNYVFLQHGVMYMVSLDSESREMFKRIELNGKYRVVVSSKAEADHFVKLGKHKEEDLYITGLPKFDRNSIDEDADKIVIMPTWRPWELNTAKQDFKETPYFKLLMKIYNNVPEELKEKVIILPHPLVANELSDADEEVKAKVLTGARYDDILKETRVLITDYSSIAYDAFYRGSSVIFYWEEKDYCMRQYGPSTKLMLNDENVYGDFFYSEEGLKESIRVNYNNPQKEEYREKYSRIVEFSDGKNTERLIELLKKDSII